MLAIIAYRLVRPTSDAGHQVREATTLREAILTILVADAAMSLENVLGVGGAAHGNVALLAFGLALSIPIVLFGSGLVASLLDRYPWGIWLGALALIWTAADMILKDPAIRSLVPELFIVDAAFAAALLAAVVVARTISARKRRRTLRRAA